MSRQPSGRAPGPGRILDAALALAGEMPWRQVTMVMIASRAGTTLERVHTHFPSRISILRAFVRRVDEAMLKGYDPEDASEPTHERLLDVLLRRFDAMDRHKAAIKSIYRDTVTNPADLLCLAPVLRNSMAWALEAAGVNSSGPFGAIRTKGLAAIFVSTLQVWLRDDTEDLSPTTAHLANNLKRADTMLRTICTNLGKREVESPI